MKFIIRGTVKKDTFHNKVIVNTTLTDREFLLEHRGEGLYKAFRFQDGKKHDQVNSALEMDVIVKYLKDGSYRLKEESYVIQD